MECSLFTILLPRYLQFIKNERYYGPTGKGILF